MFSRIVLFSGGAVAAAALLAGCGGRSGGGDEIVAAFYPLAFAAEQIAGPGMPVRNLTPAGAEPHDLELTPRNVGEIQDADVVAFLSEFQPAIDQAVIDATGEVFDARDATELVPATETGAAAPEPAHEHDHDDDDTYEVGTTDPHFWLDPVKMAEVATAFADTLAQADPAHAGTYRANAEAVGAQLAHLDRDMKAGLADCRQPDLVTSHEAFGYLARRYGLDQVGITGLTPEADPSPKQLAAVADFVEQHGVTTIYFETLTSPAVAKTLASETGATTAVLDPIEGLTDRSKGNDYLEVMRSNLATLRAGQDCS